MTQVGAYRVVFALPRGRRIGGVEVWSERMCRELGRAGVATALMNHRSSAARPDEAWCEEVAVGEGWREKLAAYRGVLPAVVVPNLTMGPYAVCARLARSSDDAGRIRVLGVCHTFEAYYFFKLHYYEPIIHRFIAVSEECAQVLRERMPHRAGDIVVRPCGVEVPQALQREYAGPDRPLRLVYAGRLVQRQKRVLDLVALGEELVARGVEFELDVVGDGPERGALEKRLAASSEPVRRRVKLMGSVPRERLPEVLQAHDACVLMSEFEGTSTFMLEGMANGCVPVVTRVSGTKAVVSEGDNGFVGEVGDVKGMAERVERLAADQQMLRRMGVKARATAQGFSIGEYVQWFRGVTDQVWAEPPRVWEGRRGLRLEARKMMWRAMEQTRHLRAVRLARDVLAKAMGR